MEFVVLDAQGKAQAQLQAPDLQAACRQWALQCWDEAAAEAAVLRISVFAVADQKGALLDPYLVVPAGLESEAVAAHEKQLDTDPHFAEEPPVPVAVPEVDTGGRG